MLHWMGPKAGIWVSCSCPTLCLWLSCDHFHPRLLQERHSMTQVDGPWIGCCTLYHPLMEPCKGNGVVQQHWVGPKAGIRVSCLCRPLCGRVPFSTKAAPREAQDDPMHWMLHIVTSYAGLMQRWWSGATHWMGPVAVPPCVCGHHVLIFTLGWSKRGTAWPT
jgi:hypothetical protein